MDTSAPRSVALVFAHFHPAGALRLDSQQFLQTCGELGIQATLVSTHFHGGNTRHLSPKTKLICRPNEGYDFYSYRTGIFDHFGFHHTEIHKVTYADWRERVLQSNLRQLALVNSSFLISRPEKLATWVMRPFSSDIHSLTKNNQIQPHLQSFLLVFNQKTIESEIFFEWWKNMTPINAREDVIRQYEVGLSQHFLKKGFQLTSEYKLNWKDRILACRSARRRGQLFSLKPLFKGQKVNPTMYFWNALWRDFGIAKIELIERNPHGFELTELKNSDDMALLRGVSTA